mmetsp:Transcript_58085/g.92298  ORF Transcript_58085/g.92298 Transcript_58085/m.92298 type:complete len:374 (+) Transcript_58085:55-1176(+)
MSTGGLVIEVGDALPTQEGVVYLMGREVDMRTRSLIYPLTVSRSSGGSYTIERSFAEAETLNEALKQRFASLPAFPRKRRITHFFLYSEKSDYWNDLREGLQTYFNALLAKENLCRDERLMDFLQQSTSKPSALSVTLDPPMRCQGDYEYGVTVSNSHFNAKYKLEWSLKRRHSEFVAFDERMRRRFPDKELPAFPRKRHVSHLLMHGSEDGWYRVQAVEIEAYLNTILSGDQAECDSMIEDSCIRELLDISDAKLKIAVRCVDSRGSTIARSSTRSAERGRASASTPVECSQSSPSRASLDRGMISARPEASNPSPLLQEWPHRDVQQSAFEQPQESHCEDVRSRLAGCCTSLRKSVRQVFRSRGDLEAQSS